MDALNLVITVSAVVVGVLSGISAFFGRSVYQARISQLQSGNDELRSQNKDLRDERIDLSSQLAACKARDDEKERLIDNYKKQPNLASLTKLIANNHKEIMKALSLRK